MTDYDVSGHSLSQCTLYYNLKLSNFAHLVLALLCQHCTHDTHRNYCVNATRRGKLLKNSFFVQLAADTNLLTMLWPDGRRPVGTVVVGSCCSISVSATPYSASELVMGCRTPASGSAPTFIHWSCTTHVSSLAPSVAPAPQRSWSGAAGASS